MQKSIVFLGLIFMSSAFCSNRDQNAAEYIVRRAYTAIAEIAEDKLFLKPETLCLKNGIVYVEDIDGVEVPIPAIFSSEERLPYMQVAENILFNLWKCSECGYWNHRWDSPTHCANCRTPR